MAKTFPTYADGPTHTIFASYLNEPDTYLTFLASQTINVKDEPFNAVGNDSADDTTAIQAAIDAAAITGGRVYFPRGTYKHVTTLVRKNAVPFVGDGIGATTLHYTGSGTAIGVAVSGTRTYRGGFHGLTLTTSTGAIGIDLDSVSLSHSANVEITGFSTAGLWLHSSVSGGCVYNRFYDVQVSSGTTGVKLDGTATNANTFFGGRTNLCTTGVSITDGGDNTFFGFQAESGTTGFFLNCTSAGLSDWNRLIGCRAENNTLYGIDVSSANVRHTYLAAPWLGTNGTDIHDLGTKTRRPDKFYNNAAGTLLTDDNLSAPNLILSSTSGSAQAAAATGWYTRGNVADSAGNVAVWSGNGTTLTNATARIHGFCRDSPVAHAQPAAYIRKDGAYEFSNGVLFLSGSGTPEGAVTAPVGSLYLRSDGGANTSHYVKETGSSSTGWVAK